MFTKSESIKELGEALQQFHAEMGKVLKAETNPFFKSKYASLSTILSAIKDPLQNAGLVFTQFPTAENELTSLVVHTKSGEWVQGSFKMAPVREQEKDARGAKIFTEEGRPVLREATPQAQGSVITYQRRYALGAILGLNIDEDDDGETASGRGGKRAPRARGYTNDEPIDPDKPPFPEAD